MRTQMYMQPRIECREVIYPFLHKILVRIDSIFEKMKRATMIRNKKRKLRPKK